MSLREYIVTKASKVRRIQDFADDVGRIQDCADDVEYVPHNDDDDDDDDSKGHPISVNMEPVYIVSPNGKFRRRLLSWQNGELLGSGSFGSVYEGLAEFICRIKELRENRAFFKLSRWYDFSSPAGSPVRYILFCSFFSPLNYKYAVAYFYSASK
ncbi:uncharacterized protein LOC112097709 isoform X2 [Citrus clementina]|uniref:uncharacterized protein LOC112097709 isoform X2 n=1 Tax=Citrus clementina TaxID=85681 RepID=UPI000CED4E98|nr:uncharacterized protein LOC112097709 isoform X2 [Citrus x clementina]